MKYRARYRALLSLLPLLLVAMLLSSCRQAVESPSTLKSSPADTAVTAIAAAIADPNRYVGDREEDAWRMPQAILEFMGVTPGMHVLDYFAAGGYFSELLARSVGPGGSVLVYNNPPYAQFAGETLVKRFANARLPNAKVVTLPTAELNLSPNSLDGVLLVMAYHDLYWTPEGASAPMGVPAQVNAQLFQALKPGGVVVVVDHAAVSGSDIVTTVNALHRIDPQVVKSDFAAAGFAFDGESDVLRHPEDDRSKLVFDEALRHKTDRFAYRFRKIAQ